MPGVGLLTRQRRARGRVVERTEARALSLVEDRDSDGDVSFRLLALASPGDETRPASGRRRPPEVWQATGDPTELRSFATWLARRCMVPLSDRTTPKAKAEDAELLLRRLTESGRVGSWVARRLGKLNGRRRQ